MCVSILPMICEWVQRGHPVCGKRREHLNDDDDDDDGIGGHGGETWGTRTYRSGWYHSIGALQFLIVMGAMGCYGMLGCEKAQAIHSLEHGRVEVSGKFAKVNHIQNYSYNFIHGSSEHCDFVQAWTNRVGEIGSIWFACCGQLINAWVQT